jgi:hypothetical protein
MELVFSTAQKLFVYYADHINHFRKYETGEPMRLISSSSVQNLASGFMIFVQMFVRVKGVTMIQLFNFHDFKLDIDKEVSCKYYSDFNVCLNIRSLMMAVRGFNSIVSLLQPNT